MQDLQTVNDPNDSEAHVIMDLASAKREVFRAEQLLADCVVREHEVMASLFKIRAATSEKKLGLDAAGDELRVDCVIVASPSRVNGMFSLTFSLSRWGSHLSRVECPSLSHTQRHYPTRLTRTRHVVSQCYIRTSCAPCIISLSSTICRHCWSIGK